MKDIYSQVWGKDTENHHAPQPPLFVKPEAIKAVFFGGFKEASLVAQTVKHLPAMRETQVQFLGQKDPREKEMVIHSSTLAWKIPWPEEPDRLQSMGSQRVGHN